MKLISFLLCLFGGRSLPAFSQKSNWLITKLQRADSVILVSHLNTNELPAADTSGHILPHPKLLVAGKPNYSIAKERRSLTIVQRMELGRILIRPIKQIILKEGRCFMPHHAIFIIKNGRTSYIDICFDCSRSMSSDDLNDILTFTI
ncbi:MAG: hypothetical protein ACRYFX_03805 [Janthinobacterium lividum]